MPVSLEPPAGNGPMQSVRKSVLVRALGRRKCSSSSIESSLYPEFSAVVRAARACSRRTPTARRRASTSTTPASAPTSRPTTSNRAGESIVDHSARWSVPPSARRVAVLDARARRLQGRVGARVRVRHAPARARRRTGVQSHREYVHRRLRPPRGRRLSGSVVIVTVVWATREVQDVVPVDDCAGRDTRRCRARIGPHRAIRTRPSRLCRYAVFGARAEGDALVAEGDRVEIVGPLIVDPKVARARRARDKSAAVKSSRGQPVAFCRSAELADGPRFADNAAVHLSSTHSPVRGGRSSSRASRSLLPPSLAQDTAALSAMSFGGAADDQGQERGRERRSSRRRIFASAALDLIGIRYKWGGNTPETGPRLQRTRPLRLPAGDGRDAPAHREGHEPPRHGRRRHRSCSRAISSFFNTRRFAFSHVGIYLGDNQFVHAPRRGREVEVATLDSGFWQRRFDGARRMAGVLPSLLPALVSEAVAAPLAVRPLLLPGSRRNSYRSLAA